jgi:hypothetical protein
MTRSPTGSASTAAPARRSLRRRILVVLLGVVVVVNLIGLSYFVLPMSGRVRSPLHLWFKPSGYVGQSAGIITLVLFLFMYLYPLRKRFSRLAFMGSIVRWLDVHIVAGLVIPLIGATHASWRFTGLIGLGYGAMLLVSLSGVVGKYIYTRIPRSRSGLELTLDQMEEQRRALARRIAERAALDPGEVESTLASVVKPRGGRSIVAAVLALVASDFARWRATRALRRRWSDPRLTMGKLDKAAVRDAIRLARRQIALTQQLRMLDSTQRVFRFWHVVHRPFSITAFVAVVIHVAVVVALGVTWFW